MADVTGNEEGISVLMFAGDGGMLGWRWPRWDSGGDRYRDPDAVAYASAHFLEAIHEDLPGEPDELGVRWLSLVPHEDDVRRA